MIFYVLVFGLLAVFVIVVGVMRMRGSRRGYGSGDSAGRSEGGSHPHASGQDHATSHHAHTTESTRRSRKAKRAESQRDRRKRK